MKYLRAAIVFALLLSLVVSCADSQKRAEAKAGIEASVVQLPRLRDFTTVKVIYEESSLSAFGVTCYYGTAVLIVGTSLPFPESLDAYEAELLALGWKPGGHSDLNSRELLRGAHERITFQAGFPGVLVDDKDYVYAQSIYTSVIIVTVDFMVPSNENC
jgi:hypothetical protein